MFSGLQRLSSAISIALLVVLLAACGSAAAPNATNAGGVSGNSPTAPAGEATSDDAGSAGSEAAFPRTIKHVKGETVIDAKPKKVAITYFPYADQLFAIGEQDVVSGVVGYKSLKAFPAYESFLQGDAVADLGDQVDLEKLMALEPDVIIASDGDEQTYEQLAKIGKTVVIAQTENWQDTIVKIAEVIGEEGKAQQYIDSYNAKLNEVAAMAENTGVQGKQAIFMMMWSKGFYYFGGIRLSPYYDGIGFSKFKNMQDWGEINLEGVSEIDPDYIFVAEDYTGTAELTMKDLEENAVWNSLKAVKDGHVYVVNTEIVGPLAMGQSNGLDFMQKLLKGE
ncbi:ABC transporter substrate-binding protein [Paenibacillus sp. BIHB 4019]|uniref:ABC transporter substrate-binding protein n=1 Tax=Paenibacillus sp. BIHB 4019 TaxID=1870819 RepID=A0A1B2DGF8_9BACL|nr:ABC transporter substrate-binding protein [Paenibacillus sp. BIHB 4019]ANY66775.1 ABC transporter substrate-binding protein [Paenibacillus sp. BIHB 4019]